MNPLLKSCKGGDCLVGVGCGLDKALEENESKEISGFGRE